MVDKGSGRASATARYQAAQQKVKEQKAESLARLVSLVQPDAALRPSVLGWRPLELSKGRVLFKVVAAVEGQLLSVFDGTTEYQLGRWTLAKHGAASWPPPDACFYAFDTAEQALHTVFPQHSRLRNAPLVLMRVEAIGRAYQNEATQAWAVSRLKPLALIT